jgi:hypothetical protein
MTDTSAEVSNASAMPSRTEVAPRKTHRFLLYLLPRIAKRKLLRDWSVTILQPLSLKFRGHFLAICEAPLDRCCRFQRPLTLNPHRLPNGISAPINCHCLTRVTTDWQVYRSVQTPHIFSFRAPKCCLCSRILLIAIVNLGKLPLRFSYNLRRGPCNHERAPGAPESTSGALKPLGECNQPAI